jgi:hypothetical protein
MRLPGSSYSTVWYDVYDEDHIRFRRFNTIEEAEYFAQDSWTIEKVVTTKILFTPEEAPF